MRLLRRRGKWESRFNHSGKAKPYDCAEAHAFQKGRYKGLGGVGEGSEKGTVGSEVSAGSLGGNGFVLLLGVRLGANRDVVCGHQTGLCPCGPTKPP